MGVEAPIWIFYGVCALYMAWRWVREEWRKAEAREQRRLAKVAYDALPEPVRKNLERAALEEKWLEEAKNLFCLEWEVTDERIGWLERNIERSLEDDGGPWTLLEDKNHRWREEGKAQNKARVAKMREAELAMRLEGDRLRSRLMHSFSDLDEDAQA